MRNKKLERASVLCFQPSYAMICDWFLQMGLEKLYVLLLLALATAILLLSLRWLLRRWRRAQERIQQICTCGYLPGPPSDAAVRAMRIVARCVTWIQVGKVTVSGLENLRCGTPRLVTATHGHYLDPFILAQFLPAPVRIMAARGLLQFGCGVGALVFSRCGAFCVDLDEGKGGPALRAAVSVVASGQTLLIFPEGWANMNGTVGPFKKGAVSIARMAAAKAGGPVAIVPVYLRYGAYPRAWITRLPISVQCLMLLFGFILYRRGVHIIIGKPLLSSDLPKNAALASEELRKAVLQLKPCGIDQTSSS